MGVSGQRFTPPLPDKGQPYPLDRRPVGPQSSSEATGKSFASAGDQTPTVQLVVRHSTHHSDWASTKELHAATIQEILIVFVAVRKVTDN
jgi:hypothetical protein